MNKKLKSIGYILLSAGIGVFLYILLHEFGHMAVMLSVGATITDFRIFTAHVSTAAAALIGLGVVLMMKKRVIHNFIAEIKHTINISTSD
ncbi:hypothetical protein V1226_04950 [Lachnospiraceae bacterium JLR.KK009]